MYNMPDGVKEVSFDEYSIRIMKGTNRQEAEKGTGG